MRPATIVLPAVGQGALGLETRSDDDDTRGLIAPLDDPVSHTAVIAERVLLSTLRGGCLAPIGAWGRWQDDKLVLDAVCLDEKGIKRLAASGSSYGQVPVELGVRLANELIARGALELIGST